MDIPLDFQDDAAVGADIAFPEHDTGWMTQQNIDTQLLPMPTKPEPVIPQQPHARVPAARKEQHSGFRSSAARTQTRSGFFDAIFAMSIFRCWHIILFYGAYATVVTYFFQGGAKWLAIPNALLKIAGTCLGFIVSYRSAQSFARYNEGRKLWCQIISTSRTFSRTVWFNLPNTMPQYTDMATEEQMARAIMEKKTVINLIEAFAVALKHYLRHEDGIYYTDLYHLVKYLPAYSMPKGIITDASQHGMVVADPGSPTAYAEKEKAIMEQGLPQPVTVARPRGAAPNTLSVESNLGYAPTSPLYSARPPMQVQPVYTGLAQPEQLTREDEVYLIPGYKPPRWAILQIWPFSILAGVRLIPASKATGDRARKIRTKIQNKATSHNLPLEITLYLGSFIAAHQRRGTSPPVINNMANYVNQLVTALTGLERILTTPIPFSYRIHLWVILCGYCLLLPHQIVKEMKWWTIPGVVLFCAVFFGFLTAGEEIENPFGYEKNDLNLDHFTHNIIRNELIAITSAPPPDPAMWAFAPENDLVFTAHHGGDAAYAKAERVSPDEWIRRGSTRMQEALRLS